MSTVQPTRAPTQLEKLSSEELLGHYCEEHEDLYAFELWKRIADRQLKWMARRFCPRWYEPDWMELGCLNRALRRFKKHICKFIGQLETPSFGAYKALLLKSAVVDEYRFVKGQGRAIMVQFGAFDDVDDMGNVIRTKREEETDLLEQLARAREEDERAISGEEENEAEPAKEEFAEEVAEEPEMKKAVDELLGRLEEPERNQPIGVEEPPRRRLYVSRRALRLLGALAQPIPRPDAALGREERKVIVRFLLLIHIVNETKAGSTDIIVRYYFRDWTDARIARLIYGDPPDTKARKRHEKRVRDTRKHDLDAMKVTLKRKFDITSLRQV